MGEGGDMHAAGREEILMTSQKEVGGGGGSRRVRIVEGQSINHEEANSERAMKAHIISRKGVVGSHAAHPSMPRARPATPVAARWIPLNISQITPTRTSASEYATRDHPCLFLHHMSPSGSRRSTSREGREWGQSRVGCA